MGTPRQTQSRETLHIFILSISILSLSQSFSGYYAFLSFLRATSPCVLCIDIWCSKTYWDGDLILSLKQRKSNRIHTQDLLSTRRYRFLFFSLPLSQYLNVSIHNIHLSIYLNISLHIYLFLSLYLNLSVSLTLSL